MKMLVIDGNSVLFRAFFATSRNMMMTKEGIYTNAVYAFANMFNKALSMIHPEYCVVAFDKGKHNFRHELTDQYKANRKPTPKELTGQFALVREFLKAYNVKYLEEDEVEGDDIIGSIAKRYPNVDTCILTSDKDLLQLLDDSTEVYFMRKGLSDLDCIDKSNLKNIWPVKPEQIIDLKALMGDASDNIPGVSGIGPKSAGDLLNKYGDLDGIYDHIDEIKGKTKDKLLAGKDSAYLSRALATIKTDVNLDIDLEDLKLDLNIEGVNLFYKKYQMMSLIKKVPKVNEDRAFRRVDHIDQNILKDGAVLYLDTDEFSYYEPKIYGLVLAHGDLVEYIPYEDFLKDEATINFLADPSNCKKVFDLKHILHAFDYKKIKLAGDIDDIMLMGFIENNYYDSLTTLFEAYDFRVDGTLKDIYGTIKKPKAIDTKLQTERSCHIALDLYKIYDQLKADLLSDKTYDLYRNVELPLTYVLYEMEKEGIVCDEGILDNIGNDIQKRLEKEVKTIYELAGHEFNINSPYQLAVVLFDELGLRANKKRSTNVEELEKLSLYHPIVNEIIKYRKDAKLYSSYIEGLKRYIQKDGKIHTIFTQTITQTGRLSSADPNLQNIAVRDEDGKVIRKAFLALKDSLLLSSDYSQIELRVLSSLSDEAKMKEAFAQGIDIHTKTAMDIFGLKREDVDEHHRRKAKACNFGIIYGISDFGLAKQVGVSLNEAREFIDNYFKTYPNIKKFMDDSIEFCKANGYVKTILNRRRYINEINSENYAQREFAKRAAMNSKVQGSAADLIKVAMVNIQKRIKEMGLRSKMVLQIHDELIFNVLNEEKETMQKLVHDEMVNALDLGVKLDVSMSFGNSWYEAK